MRARIVEHAADYPWSSYQYNGMGKPIKLITSHILYQQLGQEPQDRQANYRALFDAHMSQCTLDEIRESTNKAWVLGDSRFKAQVENVTGRSASPSHRGGDRKSEKYWESVVKGLER